MLFTKMEIKTAKWFSLKSYGGPNFARQWYQLEMRTRRFHIKRPRELVVVVSLRGRKMRSPSPPLSALLQSVFSFYQRLSKRFLIFL